MFEIVSQADVISGEIHSNYWLNNICEMPGSPCCCDEWTAAKQEKVRTKFFSKFTIDNSSSRIIAPASVCYFLLVIQLHIFRRIKMLKYSVSDPEDNVMTENSDSM